MKKIIKIQTQTAWMIVNLVNESIGIRLPEIEFISKENCGEEIMKTFNECFPNINYSYTSSRGIIYRLLRPEIITQHPKILSFASVHEAVNKMGEVLDLSRDLQYKFHNLNL